MLILGTIANVVVNDLRDHTVQISATIAYVANFSTIQNLIQNKPENIFKMFGKPF